jgi:predicted nuclease with TOPRIM domain
MELLHAQITARDEKMEEMLKDQERLEDEVYSKAGVLDRLRKQLDEMEKGRSEVERRYMDQVRDTAFQIHGASVLTRVQCLTRRAQR